MKYLLIFILILIPLIYLNRSYAYFYDYQKEHFISNPNYPSPHYFNKDWGPEVKKMVVMGDSLMAGVGSSTEEGSMGYVIAKSQSQNENIALINLAFPGVGVEDVLDRQVKKAIEEKPDYVVLMIGINDIQNKKGENLFRNYYSQILQKLTTQTNAKITPVNIPYIGSDKILYPPWNTIFDLQIKKFNKIILELALQNNLKVVELYPHFKKDFTKSSDFYSLDQFHPSDNGYKLWGEYIYANLNR